MKALLICPAERPGVARLAEAAPLALLPILGRPLVEYWLDHLVALGAKQVLLLCSDRPEQVRQVIGAGERWGLAVEVLPERCELTVAEARQKHRRSSETWLAEPHDAQLADRLPDLPDRALFTNYRTFFETLIDWTPLAGACPRLGLRQFAPGIWSGCHTRIAKDAQLIAPCWLGDFVSVGPEAVIGPMTILEDKVMIDAGAEVSNSLISPETYVGEMTEIHHSIALNNTLIDWRDGSTVVVPDAFLLSGLNEPPAAPKSWSILGRLLGLLALVATAPFALRAILESAWHNQAVLDRRDATRPPLLGEVGAGTPVKYYELAGARGWMRRWPQLWNVAKGDFSWVGNRPLTPIQASSLTADFEKRWLDAPIGLISLADAEACVDPFGDEARVHASFYAVQANWKLDSSILWRALRGVCMRSTKSWHVLTPTVPSIKLNPKYENGTTQWHFEH